MRGLKGRYSFAGLVVVFLFSFLMLELGAVMEAAALEVKIISPTSGSVVRGEVPISFLTKSNAAMVKVYIDGVFLASTPGAISWSSTNAANGMHTISAKAYTSASQLLGTSSRQVRVKNKPTPTATPTPTTGHVTITSPSSGATVSGTVSIAVTTASPVTWINFYIDGTYMASSPPFTMSWNSTAVGNGQHTISINGYDSSNSLVTTAAINLNVQNGVAATPTPTATPTGGTPTATATPTGGTPTATATPTPCAGTAYYVAAAGSDSNSGTSAGAPWKTIAHVEAAESSLEPGACVLFNGGDVWEEQLNISGVNGSSALPITFGSYGTGRPVIDGGSTRLYGIEDAYGDNGDENASNYVTVTGFEVRNATRGGIIFSDLRQVGILISNNYVHNNGYGAYPGASGFGTDDDHYGYNEGISFVNDDYSSGPDGVQIINNIVNYEGGHNAIMVDGDMGGAVIQGNQVGPGCSHNCIDMKRSVGITIQGNTTHCLPSTITVNGKSYPACNGNALYTEEDASFTSTVKYQENVAFGAASGYACFGLQAIVGPIKATYYNNTCYDTSFDFYVTTCDGGSMTVENNILDGGQVKVSGGCALTWNYNDDGGSLGKDTYSGVTTGSNDVSNMDPLYVDIGAFDAHLQAGSPVLDAGELSLILDVTWMGALGP
jgi:hypothetical protein